MFTITLTVGEWDEIMQTCHYAVTKRILAAYPPKQLAVEDRVTVQFPYSLEMELMDYELV